MAPVFRSQAQPLTPRLIKYKPDITEILCRGMKREFILLFAVILLQATTASPDCDLVPKVLLAAARRQSTTATCERLANVFWGYLFDVEGVLRAYRQSKRATAEIQQMKQAVTVINGQFEQSTSWFAHQMRRIEARDSDRAAPTTVDEPENVYTEPLVRFPDQQWLWKSLYGASEDAFKEILLKLILVNEPQRPTSPRTESRLAMATGRFRHECGKPGRSRSDLIKSICENFRAANIFSNLNLHQLDLLLSRPDYIEFFVADHGKVPNPDIFNEVGLIPLEMNPFLKHACLVLRLEEICTLVRNRWNLLAAAIPDARQRLLSLRQQYTKPELANHLRGLSVSKYTRFG